MVRLGWELPVAPLVRFLPGPHPAFVGNPWRQRLVIGWGGMRGAISLAIVLTVPTMLNGTPFAERSTLVFLAAVVVVATLIGQGLTLAPLLRVLGLAQSERHQRAEAPARAKVTEAGLARLDQLAEAGEVDEDTASVYRQLFEMRLDRVRVALGDATRTTWPTPPAPPGARPRAAGQARRAVPRGQDQRRDPPGHLPHPRPAGATAVRLISRRESPPRPVFRAVTWQGLGRLDVCWVLTCGFGRCPVRRAVAVL